MALEVLDSLPKKRGQLQALEEGPATPKKEAAKSSGCIVSVQKAKRQSCGARFHIPADNDIDACDKKQSCIGIADFKHEEVPVNDEDSIVAAAQHALVTPGDGFHDVPVAPTGGLKALMKKPASVKKEACEAPLLEESWWHEPILETWVSVARMGNKRSYITGITETTKKKRLIVEVTQKQHPRFLEVIQRLNSFINTHKLNRVQVKESNLDLLKLPVEQCQFR